VSPSVSSEVTGTVAEAFARSAARFAPNDWLEVLPQTAGAFGIDAHTWSYAEAEREVQRLRSRYAAAGYGHGHRAGLLLENRPEFLLHWLALNGLGVSVVPINPDWRSAELEYLVGHSAIALAVCWPERAAEIEAAARAAGQNVAVVDPSGGRVPPAPSRAPLADRSPDVGSECALLYTSGTTGRPKGCILPNEYFLWAGAWYAGLDGLCRIRTGCERMLTPLPLTHMNALAFSATCMLLTGGCLILLDRFHPRSWWESVRAARATIVHYLGVMPALLLAAPESRDDRAHEVRFGFGAGVNPRHHAAFEARFGFPLIEAWAMTETGAGGVVIANREPRQVGSACFGRAQPEVECRIVDDGGADVAPGATGELLVRRAGARSRFGFFAGYLKDDAATLEAWEGGWFHSGDLVTRDARGDFRFVDRKKNVIRRSGENISALEVESVVVQHPAVHAAGVAAVPDAVRGDEVFACVVLRQPTDAGEQMAREIADFCRARLAYYKAPGYVAFCPRLPLTPTEKIQRASLKELAARLLGEGQCFDLRARKRRVDA